MYCPLHWQSWECRAGGHSVSRVDSRAHYFPIQDLPPVCLHVDSPAQWSQHIISLSALFAPPLPPVQCVLYYILIWPWAPSQQGHASTSHVSSGHPRLSISRGTQDIPRGSLWNWQSICINVAFWEVLHSFAVFTNLQTNKKNYK